MTPCPVCGSELCECVKGRKVVVGRVVDLPGVAGPPYRRFVESVESFWFYDRKTGMWYAGKKFKVVA